MKRLVAILSRKPGMSDDEFRDYYETRHAPLIRSILPEGVEYRRTYTDRATLFGGSMSSPGEIPTLDFDVITMLTFPDESTYASARSALGSPENQARIAADEENFLDRAKKRIFITDHIYET